MLKPKKNTIYYFTCDDGMEGYYREMYGLRKYTRVLCLGEVKNMPDHYIVAGKDGRVTWGLHRQNLEELTAD